jgi:signal transduction histidine kinase
MFFERITEIKNSLLFRLTLLFASAFSVLAILGFAIFYYRIYSVTIERKDHEVLEEAQMYAEMLEKSGYEAVIASILGQAATENPDEEFYRLINGNGEVIFSTDISAWGDLEIEKPISEIETGGKKHAAYIIDLPDGDTEARVVTVRIGSHWFVQLGESLEEIYEYRDIFKNLLFQLITLLIAVSTLIGWLLAKRALVDMAAVTRTAEDITRKKTLDRRVTISGKFLETRRLAAAFNTMLDRIEGLLRSISQITDNIAHDLRSPIARIRGIAEMAASKKDASDDLLEMAGSTIEECDGLMEMINTMLDITEAESGVNVAKCESIDLATLVAGACELFQPLAEKKNIQLQNTLPKSLLFRGDQKRMQRIISNIIENAIKYTSVNGLITLSAWTSEETLYLRFEDTGKGIAQSDLLHIFNRFYRCDQSRSEGGVGLGLSLVKAYTESMGGSVQVQSIPDQGSIFTLCFRRVLD